MKVSGNYIKADVYSSAMSILNIYNPDVTLSKENRNKDEDEDEDEDEKMTILRSLMMNDILEQKINEQCPRLYSILK